jgi:polysaccharide pyruvyl transferase CsaB
LEASKRIVILGWYGSANVGDEAVLEATVEALRSRGFHDLHVLSTNPEQTSRALGVASSSRRPGIETLKALRGARALVLGGGGLIQDGTSIYNMPIYSLYVALARLLGLKAIGWGLGVEPLWTRLGKLLARAVVAGSDHFSVRDRESLRLLRIAGVPLDRVRVTADPAFLIPVESEGGQGESEVPHVVFCLRDLSDNHPGINLHYLLPVSVRKRLRLGWKPAPGRTEGLVRALAAGVEYCVQELGARVTLLALWPGRDDAILRHVREAAVERNVYPSMFSIRTDLARPGEVAQFVAGADLLVSMRLHALIFAARGGVPMLALAYARKMRGLMRALGMEWWLVEVESRTPPPEEITMKLEKLWARREKVGAELRASGELSRARAEADANEIARVLRAE